MFQNFEEPLVRYICSAGFCRILNGSCLKIQLFILPQQKALNNDSMDQSNLFTVLPLHLGCAGKANRIWFNSSTIENRSVNPFTFLQTSVWFFLLFQGPERFCFFILTVSCISLSSNSIEFFINGFFVNRSIVRSRGSDCRVSSRYIKKRLKILLLSKIWNLIFLIIENWKYLIIEWAFSLYNSRTLFTRPIVWNSIFVIPEDRKVIFL